MLPFVFDFQFASKNKVVRYNRIILDGNGNYIPLSGDGIFTRHADKSITDTRNPEHLNYEYACLGNGIEPFPYMPHIVCEPHTMPFLGIDRYNAIIAAGVPNKIQLDYGYDIELSDFI